eukprot:12903677-Prorocentrum_lima.AAC.1
MTPISTVASVEEVTKNICPIFAPDQGCPGGRRCQYEHSKDCPGKCVICGSVNHMSRECARPRTSEGPTPK